MKSNTVKEADLRSTHTQTHSDVFMHLYSAEQCLQVEAVDARTPSWAKMDSGVSLFC